MSKTITPLFRDMQRSPIERHGKVLVGHFPWHKLEPGPRERVPYTTWQRLGDFVDNIPDSLLLMLVFAVGILILTSPLIYQLVWG